MRTATALLLLLLALLPAGCGGRSAIGTRPLGASDGTIVSPDRGVVPRLDGSPWPPGREWGLYPGREAGFPVDQAHINVDKSCLPVPASQVQGTYVGTWTGTFSCLPTLGTTGDLKFQLTSSGGSFFTASGGLSGSLLGVPLSTSIAGGMSCTLFGGTLPNIVVGSGTSVFKGTGTMTAWLTMDASVTLGFASGTWAAAQTNGPCIGKGTWTASKQ